MLFFSFCLAHYVSGFSGEAHPFRLVPWRQEALIPLRSTPAGLPGGQSMPAALPFPASLEPPLPICPALRPRADFHARPIAALRCCPCTSLFLARRLPHCFTFEAQSHGFTARCLRLKAPFLHTNQGSLPVDGQSLSGGVIPPGLGRGFRLLATSFSPFGLLFGFASALPASQGFGWRQGNLKSRAGFMGRAEPGMEGGQSPRTQGKPGQGSGDSSRSRTSLPGRRDSCPHHGCRWTASSESHSLHDGRVGER